MWRKRYLGCHSMVVSTTLAVDLPGWLPLNTLCSVLMFGRSGSNIASVMQPGSSILCLHVDFSVEPRTVKTGILCVWCVCV